MLPKFLPLCPVLDYEWPRGLILVEHNFFKKWELNRTKKLFLISVNTLSMSSFYMSTFHLSALHEQEAKFFQKYFTLFSKLYRCTCANSTHVSRVIDHRSAKLALDLIYYIVTTYGFGCLFLGNLCLLNLFNTCFSMKVDHAMISAHKIVLSLFLRIKQIVCVQSMLYGLFFCLRWKQKFTLNVAIFWKKTSSSYSLYEAGIHQTYLQERMCQ